MFTYINENFLHAPSQDLNRDAVKTMISITLAQAQESFIEKQVRDGKKPALIAKLASQAHYHYGQAKEGLEAESVKDVFEPVWLKLIQIKTLHFHSLAEYYQALTEDQGNLQGSALARLALAQASNKQAHSFAKSFPSTPPPASNLGSDTKSTMEATTKRLMEMVQEKLTQLSKDNDFIYHQTVPAEAALQPVSKMPAAKAIPVSELYQGQDIQRIIGPDIFQKIVPMSVTESASMYDEEKAKLIRSEAEKVEQANGEMAASLDYLKLPSSLNVLKGGTDQEMSTDPEFERWCREISSHEPFDKAFSQLQRDKAAVLDSLAKSSKQLDMEESVCEKMRSKYGGEWTQQPSSRLTSTLRSDIKNYRDTVDEAAGSDTQLSGTARQYDTEFEEMRGASERGEADVMFQSALIKAGSKSEKSRQEGNLLDEDYSEGGPSVGDQILKVEDLLKKLNLVKRERMQVLKDLKEKVHTDDISNMLILNKKAIANQENQLFQAELEKFRSHQNRLISTVHKQSSLLKELTKTYGDLLQDKRVRSDQQKYDSIQKSRNTVLHRYRKVFNAHEDLIQGLMRAQGFYNEMKESVDSLEKNVETFVSNRRAEGAQLLSQIEQLKSSAAGGQAAAEQKRMQELMERLSMDPKSTSPSQGRPPTIPPMPSKSPNPVRGYSSNADPRFTIPPRDSPAPVGMNGYSMQAHTSPTTQHAQNTSPIESQQPQPNYAQGAAAPLNTGYNPMMYPERQITSPITPNVQQPHQAFTPITSPPPGQMNAFFPQSHPAQAGQPQSTVQPMNFTSPTNQHAHYSFPTYQQGHQTQPSPGYQSFQTAYGMPQNYVPPPPPPGPPGGGSTTQYPQNTGQVFPSGPGGYANYQRQTHSSAGTGHRSMGSAGQGSSAGYGTQGSSAGSGAPQQGQYQQQYQQQQQFPQQQQQQGQPAGGDPWAGLSAWK